MVYDAAKTTGMTHSLLRSFLQKHSKSRGIRLVDGLEMTPAISGVFAQLI